MDDEIYHTIDGSGGTCSTAQGWKAGETEDLDAAIRAAGDLTAQGLCGFVRRVADNAILGADGTWTREGDEGASVEIPLRLPSNMYKELENISREEGTGVESVIIQGIARWLETRRVPRTSRPTAKAADESAECSCRDVSNIISPLALR